MTRAAPGIVSELPVTPTAEVWLAMSPKARELHIEQVIAALQREEAWASEGRPHFRAKVSAATTLGEHFERIGRHMYLACELPVLYPGEMPFSPDLLAVRDVADPGDLDTRMAWSVAEEGRGLDLVLEVHYSGDKQKDLVTNVARYARLGIPEYFVYDRKAQKLYGYQLHAGRYLSIQDRRGQLRSQVLGLELGVLDGRLRFFLGEAVIPETRELLGRLERLMDQRTLRIVELEALLLEEGAARQAAEERRATLEQERATLEQERATLEQERDAALARAAALEAELARLRPTPSSGS